MIQERLSNFTLNGGFGQVWRVCASMLLVLSVVSGASVAAAGLPDEASDRRQVVLLITSGLSGSLGAANGNGTVAGVAATVNRRAAVLQAEGVEVVVMDAGRALTPSAESRVDRGATMLQVLAAAGCRLYAPDPMDFSVGAETLADLAAAVPFAVLLPLGLDEGNGLESMSAAHRLELDEGLKLEVVSVIDPVFAGDVAASLGRRVPFATPRELLADLPATAAIRLAVVHSRGHGDSLVSRSVTWELLEQDLGVPVLLDPDLGHDVVLRREGGDGPRFLVGRRREVADGWTVAEVRLDLERGNAGWRPVGVNLDVLEVDPEAPALPELEAKVQAALAGFRAQHSAALSPHAPTDWEGLSRFVLEAARERAGSEVAVLNRGALRPFPPDHDPRGLLREEAVVRMLPFDQTLVVGRVSGRVLEALARESVGRVRADGSPRMDSLVWAGLEVTVTGAGTPNVQLRSVRVNGRPLQAADTYSVVLNGFLHAGGGEYAGLTELDGEVLRNEEGAALELRDDVVLPRLREAERPFADLARRALWRYGADRLRVSFDGVSASRDDAYLGAGDSRARTTDSTSFLAEALLRADQDRHPYRWENRMRARFGLLDAEGVPVREIDDQLLAESSFLLAEIPTLAGGRAFGSLAYETEFRQNRDAAGDRLPRRQEWSLSGGITWSFTHFPRLRLGVVTREFTGFDRGRQVGVAGEGTFVRRADGRWPGIDARLLVEDMRGDAVTVRRADMEVQFQYVLRNALMFTPAVNYYIYDDSNLPGTARYLRVSVGFSYSWGGKHQRF